MSLARVLDLRLAMPGYDRRPSTFALTVRLVLFAISRQSLDSSRYDKRLSWIGAPDNETPLDLEYYECLHCWLPAWDLITVITELTK